MYTAINSLPTFGAKITPRQTKIVNMFDSGMNLSEIAQKCKVETSYVHRILQCSGKLNKAPQETMPYTENIKDSVLKNVINKLGITEDKLKDSIIL